jgi:hypothetical protein
VGVDAVVAMHLSSLLEVLLLQTVDEGSHPLQEVWMSFEESTRGGCQSLF